MKTKKLILNPKLTITPFSDESLTLDDMTIESSEDKISIYGNLDITQDEAGFKKALTLLNNIEGIVNILTYRREQNQLPAIIEKVEATQINNPFAP